MLPLILEPEMLWLESPLPTGWAGQPQQVVLVPSGLGVLRGGLKDGPQMGLSPQPPGTLTNKEPAQGSEPGC